MSCLLSTWYCHKEILAVGLCWFLPVRSDHLVGRKLLPSRGQLAPMCGSCQSFPVLSPVLQVSQGCIPNGTRNLQFSSWITSWLSCFESTVMWRLVLICDISEGFVGWNDAVFTCWLITAHVPIYRVVLLLYCISVLLPLPPPQKYILRTVGFGMAVGIITPWQHLI